MSDMIYDRRSLEVLRALMRSLAHQVRTPLSVISNELSYISRLYQTDECNKAIERCRSISGIIKSACVQSEEKAELSLCSAKGVAEDLGCDVSGVEQDFQVRLVFSEIKEAFQQMEALFSGLEAQPVQQWLALSEVTGTDSLKLLRTVTLKNELSSAVKKYYSFSSLFCLAEGLDLIAAPLADALLQANGAAVLIEMEGGAALRIAISIKRGGSEDGR